MSKTITGGIRRSVAVAAMAAAVFAGHAAAAAELSPEMKAVVAEANKEGTLKVIWPGVLLNGARGAALIEQGMNKMFGSNVKISHSPTGSLIGLGFQLANEAKANTPASTDVLIGVVHVLPMLTKNKLLVPVEWQKLLPGRITDNLVELDGRALKIATLAIGVTYNTKLLPNPPRTLEGFLDPKLKGKIATSPQGVGLDNLVAKDLFGREKALEYAKRFSSQVGGLINCNEQNRVGSGEFTAMMFDCGPIDAIRMKEAGLPIDQMLLQDYMPIGYYYGAIPVHAQHPNAAKLLVAYLATEEGQKLQWDLWREDLHLLPGSKLAERIGPAMKSGKSFEMDAEWYMAHPEIDATRGEIVKIVREGR